MGRNFVEAELVGQVARVRVQTYEYETPSRQERQPTQHQLALILTRRPDAARSYFGRLASGRSFSLGSLLYVPAAQAIRGEGPGGPHTMITCAFPAGVHDALAGFERSWSDDELVRCANLRSDWLTESMRRLAHEALNPGFGSDVLVDGLASALPVELHRLIEMRPCIRPAKKGGLSPHQLRMVEQYVCDWPGGGITVAALAALVGLSRGHFMRAFKQSTGQTVHGFVEEARLDRAKALLIEDQVPIKRIAAMLGFSDPSSFSLAFRRKTGFAPGRYRASRRMAA